MFWLFTSEIFYNIVCQCCLCYSDKLVIRMHEPVKLFVFISPIYHKEYTNKLFWLCNSSIHHVSHVSSTQSCSNMLCWNLITNNLKLRPELWSSFICLEALDFLQLMTRNWLTHHWCAHSLNMHRLYGTHTNRTKLTSLKRSRDALSDSYVETINVILVWPTWEKWSNYQHLKKGEKEPG